ncbi:MAG: D-alanyl-D-alanine endopeptidase [Candidimonas sp.]|nr:MAG: D-alanyl-D-alanine endopeptidase [Candidimonas sp.]
MRHIWNRTFLLTLLPMLALIFGLNANAYGSTSRSIHNNASSATHHTKKKVRTHAKKKVKIRAKKAAHRTVAPHKLHVSRHAKRHSSRRIATRISHIHRVALSSPGSSAQRYAPSHPETPIKHAALQSEVAYVQDMENSTVLYQKNSEEVRPIASISKLMTAIIIAEAHQPLNDKLTITEDDVDHLRHSRSRLTVGTVLSRADMLHLALMSSENRAAHALARNYPGGMPAFVRAMNDKARALGMRHTHFIEPTGLSSSNVSTPRDLVKLLVAASKQPLIHRFTTADHYEVPVGRRLQLYNNTNQLVRNPNWDIQISKTGFINESGECLVMLTKIDRREVAIILLNSSGRYSRVGDAVRLRQLVERETNLAMM